jgi:hypothetical protein
MSKPIHESKEICPLMKSKRELVCHKCAWYTHIRGMHPQTGEEIDRWDCSISLLPILMIETGRQMGTANEALVALRNDFTEGNNKRIATDVIRTQALIRANRQ